MRKITYLLSVITLGASCLFAQNTESRLPVSLGLKVGVPVTEMFNTSGSSSTGGTTSFGSYNSSVPRYEFGVSAEFFVPFHHLRFEVDGLYKPGNFNNILGGSSQSYTRTGFNQWEIPGVFKYNFSLSHYRPFVDFGASYRHISTIDQRTFLSSAAPVFDNNSTAIRNRNSFGGVAGIGVTFKKGPVSITPEARYTRWANESFRADGLRTNKDQGDVLLGISF